MGSPDELPTPLPRRRPPPVLRPVPSRQAQQGWHSRARPENAAGACCAIAIGAKTTPTAISAIRRKGAGSPSGCVGEPTAEAPALASALAELADVAPRATCPPQRFLDAAGQLAGSRQPLPVSPLLGACTAKSRLALAPAAT